MGTDCTTTRYHTSSRLPIRVVKTWCEIGGGWCFTLISSQKQRDVCLLELRTWQVSSVTSYYIPYTRGQVISTLNLNILLALSGYMWNTQVISVGILATFILITTIEKGCCRVLLNLFSALVANVATKL